ncbi:DUF2721 domain-containing protein [Exilibacterium tricleocarpae]|uniref:DUF2721 domain-containing protein n=1 Tax=Exilibacterium tricleocarpae TaxID=2591008 RepID=A0A545SNZ2_9GAMM|nr:DUF2721 domain-containing protein [Exilibacterium tricleocarpae]TQV66699.1 DUF2721 domain-containing protein [Exilibacterium tricleocarpae]
MDSQVLNIITIAQVIQTAVAPVFLLTAIAALLGVVSNRLNRIVDRARILEKKHRLTQDESLLATLRQERRYLKKRSRLLNWSFTLCVACALLICVVVVMLFYSHIRAINLSLPISSVFIVAMLVLIVGLLCLLREVYLSAMRLSQGLVMIHIDLD